MKNNSSAWLMIALIGTIGINAPSALAKEAPSRKLARFTRIFHCSGIDAQMEVYGPEELNRGTKYLGYYALDLTAQNKGKQLEPVRLSLTSDGKAVIVDQFMRGLPVTVIPLEGGSVGFDNRFADGADCQPEI